jgi:transcriptional regulator of acetoin/glycerol metabolism
MAENDRRPGAARRLREARRSLLDHGAVGAGMLEAELARSWERCQGYGLEPVGRTIGAPHASSAQLARARASCGDLLAHARPVMSFVHDQIRGSDSLVILADAQGMLLEALGDDHFAERAARIALRPGANWHERWRGTNAIGTALADGGPSTVRGGEHFFERNAFLSCAAAPIAGPDGRVLGVLDISGEQRRWHPHTLALARSAARIVEQRLFDSRVGGAWRLTLHASAEGLGTLAEARLAVAEDGWIVAADEAACTLLGLARGDWRRPIGDCLDLDPATLAAEARRGFARRVAGRDGRALWLKVGGGPALTLAARPAQLAGARSRSVESAPPAADSARTTPVADALAALDTGDAAMRQAIERARRVVGKPIALLLQGETGVGKEVFAQALHASSARRAGPFVAVNCAALPEPLIEAELFGYRPGAFTGAARQGAPGRIREAHGGTLFLDEIGDMPLALQARLLRVLQERQVVPLGGGSAVAVDFALVCATHRGLAAEMEAGRFREDLYYRVAGLTLRLPPLRERSDLATLVARLLAQIAPDDPPEVEPELLAAFARHRWRGNVRELANVLRAACALLEPHERRIGWAHLPEELALALQALPPTAADAECTDLRRLGERTVAQVLSDCAGNHAEAARRLGISRNTLYRRLRRSGPATPG